MASAAGRPRSISGRQTSPSAARALANRRTRGESRRTPAGVRATVAIEGYDQVLEIDSPLDAGAALGDRVPLTLTKARVFPVGEGVLRGDGDGI